MSAGGLVAIVVVALALLGLRVIYFDRSEAGRRTARALYANSGLLYMVRFAPATTPMYAFALLAVAPATVVPMPGRYAAIAPAVLILAASVLVVYLRPELALPRWMRVDIEQGVVERARPDLVDWVMFAFFVPLLLLTSVGAVLVGMFGFR